MTAVDVTRSDSARPIVSTSLNKNLSGCARDCVPNH
jgi:hypothetical protein